MAHQWVKFENGSQFLAEYFSQGTSALIARSDWEAKIKPHPRCEISPNDLTEIRQRQNERAMISRRKAQGLSRFSLDKIRSQPKLVRRLCQEIPKGGLLHIHPSGTVTRNQLQMILRQFNPVVDGQDLLQRVGNLTLYPDERQLLSQWKKNQKFRSASAARQKKFIDLFVLPENPSVHPFTRFDAVFVLLDWLKEDVVGKARFNQIVYEDFLARAKEDGVTYVEFTRSTGSRPDFAKVYPGLHQEFLKKYGIDVRWNAAFARPRSPEKNWDRLEALWAHAKSEGGGEVLVGVDILGNETDTPFLETGQSVYGPLLSAQRGRFHRRVLPLKMTAHAGELGDPRNVRDALIFGATRIGHGVLLLQDPVTMEWAARNSVAIENSQISNWKLGAVAKEDSHPFLHYLRLGLRVSLSTDDEGIFSSSIVDECVAAIEKTDLTYFELRQLLFNSLTAAFVNEEVKSRLLNRLEASLEEFEVRATGYLPVNQGSIQN
ncbi:MAG: hypothetical protein KDD43_02650 [Bdellovibrionales bacterium]|nr:hypothetical protein [Bdellovibrionales bacterium]